MFDHPPRKSDREMLPADLVERLQDDNLFIRLVAIIAAQYEEQLLASESENDIDPGEATPTEIAATAILVSRYLSEVVSSGWSKSTQFADLLQPQRLTEILEAIDA